MQTHITSSLSGLFNCQMSFNSIVNTCPTMFHRMTVGQTTVLSWLLYLEVRYPSTDWDPHHVHKNYCLDTEYPSLSTAWPGLTLLVLKQEYSEKNTITKADDVLIPLITRSSAAMELTMQHRSWWCHQMEAFSALLSICAGNSPVTSEFVAQRPATWSFDVFFDLQLNKRLSKQYWGWWFEMPLCPLWRQCNGFFFPWGGML